MKWIAVEDNLPEIPECAASVRVLVCDRVMAGGQRNRVADETSNTEKFRTRWRRWLGQKTRRGGSHWVTLLDTNWAHWASGVLDDELLRWQDATRESVKAHWARAINTATIQELYKLDDIYATQRWLSP